MGRGPQAPTGRPVDLASLVEGRDYRLSPGGVTRMVLPLLRRLTEEGVVDETHWVSLNPSAPPVVRLPRITLHNVWLERGRLAAYGRFKEAIWSTAHGLDGREDNPELFWTDEFPEYAYYNRRTAERMRELERREDFDLFYIHDFQQLPVGHMLTTLKPKVFRWHIPFDADLIPEAWRETVASYFNSYDTVIVSTRRYLAALRAFGFRGRARHLYPYVDPKEFSRPPAREVEAVARRLGLREEDRVALVVARMDPAKGQDRAVRALASLARRVPRLKLVLVGNGSFTSSGSGLGTSKSATWRRSLERLADKLGVRSRVVFTGHVGQRELDALYERAELTMLPSVREGFGLVVVESWLHGRPAVVTDRAGVAELIEPGRNGLLFDPDDADALSERMAELVEGSAEHRRSLGRAGFTTTKELTLDAAVKAEARMMAELAGG